MAKTYKELMDDARQIVPEVTIDDVKAQMGNGALDGFNVHRRFYNGPASGANA